MNLRTLGRLFILGNLIFVGAILNVFATNLSLPQELGPLLILVGIAGAIAGAISLLLVYKGKLSPKCPRCDSVVEFPEGLSLGNLRQLHADCPRCGCLEFSFRRLTGIKIERVTPHGMEPRENDSLDNNDEIENSEDREEHPKTIYCFVERHTKHLALFLAPVAASIAWASLHHRFTFVYLIPAFWCIAVACILISTWESGRINWKGGGVTLRSQSPITFWAHSLIWLMFYALAAFFPIGYAKQERAKEENPEVETTSPTTKDPAFTPLPPTNR